VSPRERETLNALLAGADWLSEAREVEVPTRGEPGGCCEYRITSGAGVDMGVRIGSSPAEALLLQHRDAGYGADVVRVRGERLAFATTEYRRMLGGVDAWEIEEV